ncbi:MAG: hypothetical protein ACI9XO_000163 [Paraglaciecola sp.]|jgi:hypothetical protein
MVARCPFLIEFRIGTGFSVLGTGSKLVNKKLQMNSKYFVFLIGFTLLFTACEEEEYQNPYDDIEQEEEMMTEENINLEPTSMAGLHANIFGKTCANSGCHDGNFEPDFRTIESTYNTLINAPIIKNDPQNSFQYRVVKGNVNASQLVARITYDIDGNSGIMPLAIEPDSDWEMNKETYIQNIEDWISNGAKDVFGN